MKTIYIDIRNVCRAKCSAAIPLPVQQNAHVLQRITTKTTFESSAAFPFPARQYTSTKSFIIIAIKTTFGNRFVNCRTGNRTNKTQHFFLCLSTDLAVVCITLSLSLSHIYFHFLHGNSFATASYFHFLNFTFTFCIATAWQQLGNCFLLSLFHFQFLFLHGNSHLSFYVYLLI